MATTRFPQFFAELVHNDLDKLLKEYKDQLTPEMVEYILDGEEDDKQSLLRYAPELLTDEHIADMLDIEIGCPDADLIDTVRYVIMFVPHRLTIEQIEKATEIYPWGAVDSAAEYLTDKAIDIALKKEPYKVMQDLIHRLTPDQIHWLTEELPLDMMREAIDYIPYDTLVSMVERYPYMGFKCANKVLSDQDFDRLMKAHTLQAIEGAHARMTPEQVEFCVTNYAKYTLPMFKDRLTDEQVGILVKDFPTVALKYIPHRFTAEHWDYVSQYCPHEVIQYMTNKVSLDQLVELAKHTVKMRMQ